jgi:hypothetical protein
MTWTDAQADRDRRRRHAKMALRISTLASAAEFAAAMEAADPATRQLATDIMSGARALPEGYVKPDKKIATPAPGQTREQRIAAVAKRDAYLSQVGGMWPERSLKREGVAVFKGRPPVERSAPGPVTPREIFETPREVIGKVGNLKAWS